MISSPSIIPEIKITRYRRVLASNRRCWCEGCEQNIYSARAIWWMLFSKFRIRLLLWTRKRTWLISGARIVWMVKGRFIYEVLAFRVHSRSPCLVTTSKSALEFNSWLTADDSNSQLDWLMYGDWSATPTERHDHEWRFVKTCSGCFVRSYGQTFVLKFVSLFSLLY